DGTKITGAGEPAARDENQPAIVPQGRQVPAPVRRVLGRQKRGRNQVSGDRVLQPIGGLSLCLSTMIWRSGLSRKPITHACGREEGVPDGRRKCSPAI